MSAAELLQTYFTFRVLLLLLSLGGLALATPLISAWYPHMPLLGVVMLALTAAEVLRGLNDVQMTILDRRLAFRRIAAADAASSVVMTIVAPADGLARPGCVGAGGRTGQRICRTRSLVVWAGSQSWRARLGWGPDTARWLIQYGWAVWLGGNLTYLLDRFDDFWIGRSLGPHRWVSMPEPMTSPAIHAGWWPIPSFRYFSPPLPVCNRIAPGFRAFFRAASLMIRTGGLFSLLFVLTAPEFIPLLLGPQWLPMLLTFQLMIVYTFLDPLALSASNLLSATGQPQCVFALTRRAGHLFPTAVIIASRRWGIEGVAVAADLMALLGAILLFRPRAAWSITRNCGCGSGRCWP